MKEKQHRKQGGDMKRRYEHREEHAAELHKTNLAGMGAYLYTI